MEEITPYMLGAGDTATGRLLTQPAVISLTLDPTKLSNQPVHRGIALLARLRERGIPASGVLSVEGVDYGTLSISSPDLCTGEVLYIWVDQPVV